MREGESCIHNCLASSSNPLTEKKTKQQNSVSQVFVELRLLQPAVRDSHYWMAGVEGLVSSQMHVSVWVGCSCASWVVNHWRLALCRSMGWLGFQSRAKSGWVFSFSPFSSCFRVPASTTDWDLIGERRRKIWLQTTHGGNNFGTLAFRFYIPLITHDTQNKIPPPFYSSVFLTFVSPTPYFYGMRDLGIFFTEISSIGERNTSSHSSPVSKCSMALEMWKVK